MPLTMNVTYPLIIHKKSETILLFCHHFLAENKRGLKATTDLDHSILTPAIFLNSSVVG
jgi:hypothetical protein